MKIYRKIVIDMVTGDILYSDSFDYKGDVTQCCGGGGGSSAPAYPEPSPEEKELLQLQLQWLKDMGADMALMRPFILKNMGLIEESDGSLRKMSDDEYYENLGELEQEQYDVTRASLERLKKAYAGELEISPALEKKLGQSESQMEEALSQKLGPDWRTTTAGMQAKSAFMESASLIREEARTGLISSGTGASLANLGYMSNIDVGDYEKQSAFPGQAGGLFAGAGQMAGYYGQERANKYGAQMNAYQSRMNRRAGLMGGFGSLLGSGMQAYGMYKGLMF